MKKLKKKIPKWVLWLNLIIGFYNLHLYVNDGGWLLLVIGSLNIGICVLYRKDLLNVRKT